jgi:hypothetical protein
VKAFPKSKTFRWRRESGGRLVNETSFHRKLQRTDLPFRPAPTRKKYCFAADPNQPYIHGRPTPERGAYRDRHERWVRDAVDASDATDESVILRTAKSCGPVIPTLMSSLRGDVRAGDGGKKARSPGRARYKP